MLTESQCCVLETRKNRISVYNLNSPELFPINFDFKFEEADQNFLEVFPDSQSVVVRQQGRYNNNYMKLSYFHYPLHPESKPYLEWETTEEWTYEYMVRKANNHSMYCWFKGRHDEAF